jgi:hypothetical protein
MLAFTGGSSSPRLVRVLAWASIVLSLLLVEVIAASDGLFADYRATLWEAGRDIFAGRSPYPDPERLGYPAVYPPPAIVAAAPLALLPFPFAAAAWGAILVAAALVLVRTLAIRDRALAVVVLASPPVVTAVWLGNVTLLVVLAAAVAWTVRDRPAAVAAAVAFGIASKLLLWPLLVWLAFTRRFRAAVLAVAASASIMIASWAAIGFRGFLEYPALLDSLVREYGPSSISIYAVLTAVGVAKTAAVAASIAVGGALLGAAGWTFRRTGDECASYALAMVASFAVAPVSWTHNLGFLLVAIAVTAPRGGALWYVVPALWLVVLAAAASTALAAGVALALAGVVACRPYLRRARSSAAGAQPVPST